MSTGLLFSMPPLTICDVSQLVCTKEVENDLLGKKGKDVRGEWKHFQSTDLIQWQVFQQIHFSLLLSHVIRICGCYTHHPVWQSVMSRTIQLCRMEFDESWRRMFLLPKTGTLFQYYTKDHFSIEINSWFG